MPTASYAVAGLPASQQTIKDFTLEELVNVSSAGAGAWTVDPGDWADPVRFGYGETSNNNAKTLDLIADIEVPLTKVTPDSNPGQIDNATAVPLQVVVEARLTGTPATSSSLDCSVFKLDRRAGKDITIGTSGELCTTSPQNMLTAGANNWTTYTFAIDADDLEQGDRISIALRATNNDTGGGGGGRVEIGAVKVVGYVHGGIR